MPDLSLARTFALAKRAVVFELRLYRSLFRWVTRRRDLGGPEDTPFGYVKTVTPVMWLWITASMVEVVVVHVLLPWDAVRIALLVVGVWGLVWMVGLLASLYVYPHLLGPAMLRVRHGASHRITLPWDVVASVTHRRRDLDSSVWTLQPRETERGLHLQVGVSGQVNVHARLRQPTVVSTAKGQMEIVELSFFADDPRALVADARKIPYAARGTTTLTSVPRLSTACVLAGTPGESSRDVSPRPMPRPPDARTTPGADGRAHRQHRA